MNAMIMVLKEQINSLYLIKRLSIYQVKSTNKDNYLGIVWEMLNPDPNGHLLVCFWNCNKRWFRGKWCSIYILVDFCISVWFFINPATMQASKSIYTRLNMISRMSFPMSVIPSYVIMSNFYQHLVLIGIVTFDIFSIGSRDFNLLYSIDLLYVCHSYACFCVFFNYFYFIYDRT